MAGSLMSRNGGNKASGRGYRPMAEINVTPFVDVMLVLLIVFMVTAPLLTVGVPVELPRTDAQNISEPEEPLVITVQTDGTVFVQDTEVESGNLIPLLQAITDANPETTIYVRGDRELAYGRMMEVLGSVTRAGFLRVSLVAEQPSAAPPSAN
ncbi:MAG: ExbD/TolR family protein [Azospirillaceae bacterium]